MKIIILGILLLGINVSMTVPTNFSLSITISGFSSNEGKASVAIYRVSDDFPGAKSKYKAKVVLI
jgi:uncharacterized protein (DUF2141 family)